MKHLKAINPCRSLGGLLSLFVLGGLLTMPAQAQSAPPSAGPSATGAVTGTVLDEGTRRFLEGAEISVTGTDIVAVSSRDGSFTLRGVPAGRHSYTVTYPGLDEAAGTIEVVAAATAPLGVIRLRAADTIVLEKFRVTTAREGMSRAQALQKASAQAKVVAASDQFGDISTAEGNLAEYLKFLPGISIHYGGNDARAISLRGLSPSQTVVTVDGALMAMATSSQDSREFQTEQTSFNNVETIEVYKTLTPDQRADGTGGSINLITKSAFDREEDQFTYNVFLEGNSDHLTTNKIPQQGNEKQYAIRPNADFNYAARLTPRIGVNLNYRYSDVSIDRTTRGGYTWEFNPANGGSATNPYLRQFATGHQPKNTQRQSLAGKVDFRLREGTRLSLSGQWNWYDLLFLQQQAQFDVGTKPDAYSTFDFVNGRAGQGTITNSASQRSKYGTTYHFAANLTHELGANHFTAGAYWSEADSQYRDTTKGFVQQYQPTITGNTISFANIANIVGTLPSVTATKSGLTGEYYRQLINYTGATTSANSTPNSSGDTKKGGNFDLSHDFNSRWPLTVRIGGVFDRTDRDIRRQTIQLANGTPALTPAEIAGITDTLHTDPFPWGFGSYETGDLYKIFDLRGSLLTRVTNDQARAIVEKNSAAFVRFDLQPAANLLLVGGVRYEKREMTAEGVTSSTAFSRQVDATIDYTNWFPSLNLKYTPAKNWVVRAGVSRSIGHPDYSDLIPTATDPSPSGALGLLTIPNPFLKPFHSTNYDLTFERYTSSGVVSVALFRKDTTDFINRSSQTALSGLPPSEIDAIVAEYGIAAADIGNYNISQAINGAPTKLQGVELSVAQTLSFLPKPFNTLGLQANFTKIDVSSPDPATALALTDDAATTTAALALNWRIGRFSFLATASYADDVFLATQVQGGVNTTRYLESKFRTDFRVDYALHRRAIVYVQLRNLTGGEREEYRLTPDGLRLPNIYHEFSDPLIVLGVRGLF